MWGRKSDTWTNQKPPSNSEVGEEGDSFDFGKLRRLNTPFPNERN
jgi:hypothetical protein